MPTFRLAYTHNPLPHHLRLTRHLHSFTRKTMPSATTFKCQHHPSSRRPRLRLLAVLIYTQPIDPTTDLRFVPVTRRRALVLRRGYAGSRLDAFTVGVAAAVTSNSAVSFDHSIPLGRYQKHKRTTS